MSNTRELSFGAGLWMFGQFVDRYATDAYGPPVGVLEAIDRADRSVSWSPLDINYPFESGVGVDQIRAALERNKLRCRAYDNGLLSCRLQPPGTVMRLRRSHSFDEARVAEVLSGEMANKLADLIQIVCIPWTFRSPAWMRDPWTIGKANDVGSLLS